jgi:serine/threonine protein kinase
MRDNPNELNHLIIELCKALMLLNAHNIVHSDLKTENILLRLNHSKPFSNLIKDVKIIDFGSSFVMTNLKQFSMATPEYMPP